MVWGVQGLGFQGFRGLGFRGLGFRSVSSWPAPGSKTKDSHICSDVHRNNIESLEKSIGFIITTTIMPIVISSENS